MRKREAQALAKRIIKGLDKTYDLIYVDYRDQLSDDQVAFIVSGDTDKLWESTWEWESDSSHEGTQYVIKEIFENLDDDERDALDHYDLTDELTDDLENAIRERESGDWIKQLIGHTPDVLIRVTLLDEDDCFSFEEVAVDAFLTKTGFADTPKNREAAAEVIANACPEFGVGMVSVLASVGVDDIWAMPYDTKQVEITNPHLWLGNPFAGSGYAAEFEGTVIVAREDLRTDKDAFGYGWQDVISGDYQTDSSIRAIEPTTETETP